MPLGPSADNGNLIEGHPREGKAAVSIHGFPHPNDEVEPEDGDVCVEEEGSGEGGQGVCQDLLYGVRVLCREAHRLFKEVVLLVNAAVERRVVEEPVRPVEEEVVDEEEEQGRAQEGPYGGQWSVNVEAERCEGPEEQVDPHRLKQRVEQPVLNARPDQGPVRPLLRRLDLVLGEPPEPVDEVEDAVQAPKSPLITNI